MSMPHEEIDKFPLLRERIEHYARDVEDFSVGNSALAIGGTARLYVPLIRNLGAGLITVVELGNNEAIQEAIHGDLPEGVTSYGGMLEDYVKPRRHMPQPADSAFVFNPNRPTADSVEFMDALTKAVRVGGWIVMTTMEWDVSKRFRGTATGIFKDALMLRNAYPRLPWSPIPERGPHHLIQIWERVQAGNTTA